MRTGASTLRLSSTSAPDSDARSLLVRSLARSVGRILLLAQSSSAGVHTNQAREQRSTRRRTDRRPDSYSACDWSRRWKASAILLGHCSGAAATALPVRRTVRAARGQRGWADKWKSPSGAVVLGWLAWISRLRSWVRDQQHHPLTVVRSLPQNACSNLHRYSKSQRLAQASRLS